MNDRGKRRLLSLFLLAGDIALLFASLWLALFLRYLERPSTKVFSEHLGPFSLLFIVWLLIFYIADLYGRSFYLGKKNLLRILFKSQLANSLVAVIFFYTLTFYRITPKTVLLIDLLVSFGLLFAWRWLVRYLLKFNALEKLVIIGSGHELDELEAELRQNERYGFRVVAKIGSHDLVSNFNSGANERIESLIKNEKDLIFTIDSFKALPPPVVAYLYDLMFRGIEFLDFQEIYESIFQYVPLSFVNDEWLLANISAGRNNFYDLPKRWLDILLAFLGGIFFLLLAPFIALAIKLNDGGPIFFVNSRVGQNNKTFRQIKFRTMRVGADARWPEKNDKRITRVGSYLRASRLDELPQLWNVLQGDMSFVGPRPDFVEFAPLLEKQIPYYNIRNIIKPGLTGWGQIQQAPPASVEETQRRLAYDIYYIKNRSLPLDLKIVLHTARIIFETAGS